MAKKINRGKILVIDDEKDLLTLLSKTLELEDYEVYRAETAQAGWDILNAVAIEVVLTDVKLPDISGLDLLERIKSNHPEIEVICLTAFGRVADGVRAIQLGAFDYLVKGDDNIKLIPLVSRAVEKYRLKTRVKVLEAQFIPDRGFEAILGESQVIKHAIRLAEKVAVTDTTVLITGPTGTGKEVFSKAIHFSSRRAGKQFVAINCSAFSRELLESELFGYKAGAFTGATKDKAGLFEAADGGTLFLDEIGEMDIELQSKLLRVLETNTFFRVGDNREKQVDIRIIAATNRDLTDEIAEGRFRQDLFFRINVFQIALPSLEERKEDIPLLAAYFLKRLGPKINPKVTRISDAFISGLLAHTWKGNIRELKNHIERALILANGETLTPDLFSPEFTRQQNQEHAMMSLKDWEIVHIQKALTRNKGNKTRTAVELGIGLTTLYAKIKEYDLDS